MPSVRAPEGDNFEIVAAHPVVDVMTHALEKPASGLGRFCVLDFRPDLWELDKQLQRSLEIVGYGARGGEAFLAPPSCSLVDFAPCARLDPDSESQD